jgi:hypothetical protein
MRLRRTGAAGVAVLLLAGCSGIPDAGPVVVVEASDEPTFSSLVRIDPASPEPGSSPRQLVSDFMSAMQAYPVSTDVAREFLSSDAADSWNPEQGTVIYETVDYGEEPGGAVEMQVVERARLGAQGTYYPRIAGQQRKPVQWRLVQEEGEWRIANPPDLLYVRAAHFEDYYGSYNLYFLDSSQQVAVGEPAYFPAGDQLATNLVRALLDGPSASTAAHVRTAIPSNERLEVAIPIGPDGVAEVRLTGPEDELSELQAQLMSVQVVSTLRQVPGVLGVRIVVNDQPLEVGGLTDIQDVSSWRYYIPAVNVVERRLFALAKGRLVTIEGAFVAPVEAPVGQQPQDLRWVLVKESPQLLLGVSRDGRRLLTGAIGSGDPLTATEVRGTDLGRPTHAGSVGVAVVDRTTEDSSLVVVENIADPDARRVSLGLLASSYVDAFSISPDGVRFVAVASESSDPAAPSRLVTGWIARGRDGQVSGVSGVRSVILSGEQLADVRDAGWVGESTLAVIGRFSDSQEEIYTVDIDGSDLSGGQVSGEPLPEELDPVWLATAGLEDAPVYATSRDGTLWLPDEDGQWRALAGVERLRSATFAG